jgi:hypothetical protein
LRVSWSLGILTLLAGFAFFTLNRPMWLCTKTTSGTVRGGDVARIHRPGWGST